MRTDYKAVVARFERWGLGRLLEKAYSVHVSPKLAKMYVAAICGAKTRVKITRINRGWAHYSINMISLARRTDGKVRMRDVIHECAHLKNHEKGRKLRGNPHGEAFCRTYARLLKECLE